MKYKNNNTIHSMYKLSCALSNMNNIKLLDDRLYWITAHINQTNDNQIKYIMKQVYNSVNYKFKLMNSKGKDVTNKNSLIIDYDVEKGACINGEKEIPLVPHLHGLVIINAENRKNYNEKEIHDHLLNGIKENSNISDYIRDVKIDKFKLNKSVLDYTNYSGKLSSRTDVISNIPTYIFPYEQIIFNKSSRAKEITTNNCKKALLCMLDPDQEMFSEEHYQLIMNSYKQVSPNYFHAKTKEEQDRCRNNFIKSVFI